MLHWGADLPDDAVAALRRCSRRRRCRTAPLDAPWPLTVLPGPADGWLGTPGYAGHRAGGSAAPRAGPRRTQALGDGVVEVDPAADEAPTVLSLRYRLDAHGVLAVDAVGDEHDR